jgi:hypothetical protein
MEAIKLAGAFAVPLVAVAALFYGIMDSSLQPVRDDVKTLRDVVYELRDDVQALEVTTARLDERLEERLPRAAQSL